MRERRSVLTRVTEGYEVVTVKMRFNIVNGIQKRSKNYSITITNYKDVHRGVKIPGKAVVWRGSWLVLSFSRIIPTSSNAGVSGRLNPSTGSSKGIGSYVGVVKYRPPIQSLLIRERDDWVPPKITYKKIIDHETHPRCCGHGRFVHRRFRQGSHPHRRRQVLEVRPQEGR